jgi:ppGpp synthetase/RelA/SpoT-type nucleotidyltranferase
MELDGKYKILRPQYEKMAERVREALKIKVEEAGLKITPIICRAKTIESFLDKLQRKSYSDPLSEITDLAGVRIVCMYEPDIKKIEDIIQREFKVCERVDKYREAGSDKMGYLGLHFIVKLRDHYSGPHYDGLHALKCEIQVRTILQDSWALISHHLVYKEESSIPNKIRRDLNNVASLLEIAQGVFDTAKEKIESYVTEIHQKETVPDEFLSQPVDYETLYAYTQWK